MRTLLVEDDAMLAEALQLALHREGASVDIAADARSAQTALVDHDYELILLDLGLPGGSGMGILSQLRARYDTTPVIIMTARDRLSERIAGLDAGADDYLVKPFQIDELLARARATVRRSKGRVAPVLMAGNVTVDPANQTVLLAGDAVALSLLEYRTLLALVERGGRAVSRAALESSVYGDSGATGSNTVAVYIHQLRRKLGDDLIETVHGYGYRVKGM
ncbi:DNA-binding response regulator [Bordetella tumbae]|uniref:response regulator n=1 Tax=Bordetella tumbae TaxID=1649139 RepID=UPI0039EDF748